MAVVPTATTGHDNVPGSAETVRALLNECRNRPTVLVRVNPPACLWDVARLVAYTPVSETPCVTFTLETDSGVRFTVPQDQVKFPEQPAEHAPGTVVILRRRGASLPVWIIGHDHVDGGVIRYRVRTTNDYVLTDVEPAWLSTVPAEVRNQEDARNVGLVRAYEAPLDVEPLDLSGDVAAEARRLGATPQRADVAGREAFVILRRRQAAAHAAGEWCHGNGCLCGAPRSDGTRADVDEATAATYRQLARA